MWYKDIIINKLSFRIKLANDNKHKYVAWLVSKTDDPEKLFLSRPTKFGAYDMSHYRDKLGYYKNLNHEDEKRLQNFRKRFKKLYEKNKDNPYSGIYWSWNYLW